MKTEQEQINEIAKTMCEEFGTDVCNYDCPCINTCANILIAKRLIAAGYRKQSDTVREFVEKVLKIGSKRPLCVFNEYGEGYIDCIENIKKIAAQYGVEVKK